MGLQEFVNTAAPALSAAEKIYLQSLIELTRSQLGQHPHVSPCLSTMQSSTQTYSIVLQPLPTELKMLCASADVPVMCQG